MGRKRTTPVAEHIESQQPTGTAPQAEPPPKPVAENPKPEELPAEARVEAVLETTPGVMRGSDLPTQKEHPKDPLAIFEKRDWTKFADPRDFHQARWPDGYSIRLQESGSRRTIEIQFGDGSRKDRAVNFAKIKPLLEATGMHWNGTNAWVIDLVPERGSLAQREDAKRQNRDIRLDVEEKVFPAVIGLEEELRGQINVTDEYRKRIAATRSGNGRE